MCWLRKRKPLRNDVRCIFDRGTPNLIMKEKISVPEKSRGAEGYGEVKIDENI